MPHGPPIGAREVAAAAHYSQQIHSSSTASNAAIVVGGKRAMGGRGCLFAFVNQNSVQHGARARGPSLPRRCVRAFLFITSHTKSGM